MNASMWRGLVVDAVRRSADGEPELLDLLALLLAEQDHAKQHLRDLGFGCTGMSWLDTVNEVRKVTEAP